MMKIKRTALFALLFSLLFPFAGSTQNLECVQLFSELRTQSTQSYLSSQVRSIEEIQELVIMTFNVENLFVSVGKFEHDVPGKMRKVEGEGMNARAKPLNEIREIVKIIDDANPDVITLQEVESIAALEMLAGKLGRKYKPYLIEGNDGRGIDIGFLVKVDLPFDIQYKTFKNEIWTDPVSGKQEKLFSRDLPAMEFRLNKNQADPSFVLFGNHAKSKRDRPNDRESVKWRTAQYDRASEIVERYLQKGIHVLFGGDFNIDIHRDHEADRLKQKLSSSFDSAEESLPIEKRITHTYHPRGEPVHKAQMDDIWISSGLRGQVKAATIYPYRYPDGSLMPVADTFRQREKQPSDHWPVIVRVLTKVLFGN